MKINKIFLVFGFLFLATGLLGCSKKQDTQVSKSQTPNEGQSMTNQAITIKTARGEIKIALYADKAPKTVANFEAKAKAGFYKDLIFHRVEDWVLQGGDPLGNGTGGGDMPTELSDAPFKIGSVGVARAGDIKVSNDSQFFICTADCSFLTGQYTNFGEVTQGLDVAKSMQIGDKIGNIEIN